MTDNIGLWNLWTEIEPYKLPKTTNKILQGYSIAGLRTNFFIGPDLTLDAGLSTPYNTKYILVTHGHSDHIASIPFHLYRPSPDLDPIKIFCPKEIVQLLDNYILSMFQLSEGDADFKPYGYEIIGIDANTEPVEIILGKVPHVLEFYQCVHSVPCIGYGLSIVKTKLKPEYVGLPQNEIKVLRLAGTAITCKISEPELYFSGDTTHELFEIESNKKILSYPNIIIECTFVLDEDLTHAQEKKHMNWINLKPYVISNPNVNFILTHFSQKYRKTQVEEFFVQENLPNVKPWINIK